MKQDRLNKIKELNERLKQLPKGYISTKVINGHIYYYHQWSDDGEKTSKYLNESELADLNNKLKERRRITNEIMALKRGYDIEDTFSCTLMHKNEKVIDILLDKNNGALRDIGEIYSINHLPIGTYDEKGHIDLVEWWVDRSIPLSRSGIVDALEKLNVPNTQVLLLKCYGLSLSDQYWIKPKEENIKWEDINFFDNDFSDDIGRVLFDNHTPDSNALDLSSPDSTSIGNLKKRWRIIDGKRVLIKGGSNPFRQEPINEVIAYKVAKVMDLPCIPYNVYYQDEVPYSECEDFINKEEDLVPAYSISKIIKKSNNDSSYTHLLKCTKKLGIDNYEDYLNKLITFDFIIANVDRHLNNFGIVVDANTLRPIGPSPIFDSGSSFGFDSITADIKPFKNIETKPFKTNPIEQLSLVTSFSWLKIEQLEYIKEHIEEWFLEYESKYLDKDRIKAISESVKGRIDYLIKLMNK